LFEQFVNKHRSPTGRTPDATGRFHGAVFYLDAKWKAMRPGRSESGVADHSLDFSTSFNLALQAAKLPPVHPDVPPRWLKELFGPRCQTNGVDEPSSQHTTIYPHKSDACPLCEMLLADIRHTVQVAKRHKQQSDQSSLTRRAAIAEAEQTEQDLRDALADHKEEAEIARDHHRKCVDGADERYQKQAAAFIEYMSIQPGGEEIDTDDSTTQEQFVRDPSSGWFDVSSDHQQDKTLPS